MTGKPVLHEADFSQSSYFWRPKRTVIVLPGYLGSGNTGSEKSTQTISGGIKGIEQMLARSNQLSSTDIFCVAYSHTPEQLKTNIGPYISMEASTITPGAMPDERAFVDHVLMPLMGFKRESHPNVDAICQRLSQVTLVAHSFGSVFAHHACGLMRTALTHEGYSTIDIDRITREVTTISLGSPVPLQHQGVGFRTINFSPQCDRRLWYAYRDHANATVPPEQAAASQRAYYEALGLDAELLQKRLPVLENETYSPLTTQFQSKPSANGLSLYADVPNKLRWKEGDTVREEASAVPEHAFTMFMMRGEPDAKGRSNYHMVDKVTQALSNAIDRPVSTPENWRQEVHKMANATPKFKQAGMQQGAS